MSLERLGAAFNFVLGTSPSTSTEDWLEFNERIRRDDDQTTQQSEHEHVCSIFCYSDTRRVLRALLSGTTSVELGDHIGGRSQAHIDCLRERLLRLCQRELGYVFIDRVDIQPSEQTGPGGFSIIVVTIKSSQEEDE